MHLISQLFLVHCFSAFSVHCSPLGMLSSVKWPLSCCQKKGNMKMLMKEAKEKQAIVSTSF